MQNIFAAIDLKSFYASVECVERGLNPFNVNLVVADSSRTEKTICLAVSPALKSFGVPGRPRLFEVISQVKAVNLERKRQNKFSQQGKSYYLDELKAHKNLAVDFIVAKPQMGLYIDYSTRIYQIYLKYIAPEDIHVYSIDEVFIDLTSYLKTYNLSPKQLVQKIILAIIKETGITATAGIGTNLYLAKVAMDIIAKHVEPDSHGVRIAELDTLSYRQKLWSHRPLTDFWRVGRGYSDKLEAFGLYTMGDIALMSVDNDDWFYDTFGINAELLIDHAWGYEPCTINYIKAYKPSVKSLSSGQVLTCAYTFDKALLVVKEMADLLALDLVANKLVTNQIVLTIGYDVETVTSNFKGEITLDRYGRKIPKHAHGTFNLDIYTSQATKLINAAVELYRKIVNPEYLIRRINITAGKVVNEDLAINELPIEQLDFFTDYEEENKKAEQVKQAQEKEKKSQKAVLEIKKKYGKNAILKGMNLENGATAKERNGQIGGHRK